MTKYDDFLSLQLMKTRDVVMNYFRPILIENDLTEQQWRIMRILDTEGPLDFSTLSKESCILSPSLTGIINRLEKQDYVFKKKSLHDGRQCYIHLTEKAQLLVARLHPQIESQYILLKQHFGKDKYQKLSQLLDELTQLSKK